MTDPKLDLSGNFADQLKIATDYLTSQEFKDSERKSRTDVLKRIIYDRALRGYKFYEVDIWRGCGGPDQRKFLREFADFPEAKDLSAALDGLDVVEIECPKEDFDSSSHCHLRYYLVTWA